MQILETQLIVGDAKFINNEYVIANRQNLQIININTQEDTDLGSRSNWTDVVYDGANYSIVYANFNKQVGICQYDSSYKIIFDKIVFEGYDEDLIIDPSITFIDNKYYITLTKINGNINNADSSKENGLYTISLYSSEDLINLTFITDIVSYKNNIEDVELVQSNKTFYFLYEKEELDKGISYICMKKSDDLGKTWSDELVLISNNSDNEPAKLFIDENGFSVFYSSDLKNPGSSYMGANVFCSYFNNNMELLNTTEISTNLFNNGILLYDVLKIDESSVKLLYAHNYLSDNDLCVETCTLK